MPNRGIQSGIKSKGRARYANAATNKHTPREIRKCALPSLSGLVKSSSVKFCGSGGEVSGRLVWSFGRDENEMLNSWMVDGWMLFLDVERLNVPKPTTHRVPDEQPGKAGDQGHQHRLLHGNLGEPSDGAHGAWRGGGGRAACAEQCEELRMSRSLVRDFDSTSKTIVP